jgi:hypothetical protein
VDGDASVLPLEAHPRTPLSLLVRVLAHVFGLLQNGVDAVVVNRNVVSHPEDVSDGHCARAEALAQFQNPLFEIGGILRIRLTSRHLQLWNLAVVTALFDELLDSPPADLELLGDQPGVHAMINNPLTYPGNILLVKLHLRWSIVREITSTKSLADTTCCNLPVAIRYDPGN